MILGAVLVIAGPHWVRNQAWFGTPLGVHRAEAGGAQGNEDFSWRAVVSIAARNTALHFASPWAAGNAAVEAGVGRMHAALGRDVRDPRTTLLGMEFSLPWRPRNETTAGAPERQPGKQRAKTEPQLHGRTRSRLVSRPPRQ